MGGSEEIRRSLLSALPTKVDDARVQEGVTASFLEATVSDANAVRAFEKKFDAAPLQS
jgi:hypothetical protein